MFHYTLSVVFRGSSVVEQETVNLLVVGSNPPPGANIFTNMTIEEIRKKIIPLLKPYNISRVGLFGSAARGEMSVDSDIDILVEIGSDVSLLTFVEIKQRLEEELGRKVDLVEYETIKPSLKVNIMQNHVSLL